ncbi:hypothetical protein [Paenibacillus sp. FSL H8-0259]|uniref:hypothetical protein n=1 Tax=Paenibacillus sp. FSL H8-0259 TaxID=1920423 RepID=UPI00096D2049|nr:hypothetical protein [Paenibacillus sp. FSL H8-0259]OMF27776.1 hypothetical protein BK132_16055 [Paenibacillus sp. FSL H8-0259]
MDVPVKNRMHWELTYIFLLTGLIILLAAAVRGCSEQMAVAGFAAALALNCWVWKQTVSRTVVYLHNGLNIICAVLLAYLLSAYVFVSDSTVIGAAFGVVVMDVFSFTKRGGFTLNARLMERKNTAVRLSVCLPVPGKRGLIPVIGTGDLVFYSLLTIVPLQSVNRAGPLIAVLPILAGQLLNLAIIAALKNRAGFKGFPATLMPGLLFIAVVLPGIQP